MCRSLWAFFAFSLIVGLPCLKSGRNRGFADPALTVHPACVKNDTSYLKSECQNRHIQQKPALFSRFIVHIIGHMEKIQI